MERRFYKELWNVRFKKMLELEKQSAQDYLLLRDECKKRFPNHAIVEHLERLIAEEQKHAVLAQELIEILERQPL